LAAKACQRRSSYTVPSFRAVISQATVTIDPTILHLRDKISICLFPRAMFYPVICACEHDDAIAPISQQPMKQTPPLATPVGAKSIAQNGLSRKDLTTHLSQQRARCRQSEMDEVRSENPVF
jgi:hypothetical protein